jgi:uncharacterized protein (DUF1015 family)
MPSVYPFRAVQFTQRPDLSALVAPPYDVLDASATGRMLAKNGRNIVAIDLPHTPAKELGPPESYAKAAEMYRVWLSDGTLKRGEEPAMFAYRQTTRTPDGKVSQRSGMACCVETVPFGPREGGGILPHEETFSGPKEDRFALMKATKSQLSPIFGLHADEKGAATKLLQGVMGRGEPDITADMGDGVLHEVWTITDDATIAAYQRALAGEDVFIADGHHRYNTALNYIKHLEAEGSKPLAADHPARRCMMVMVGMSDPGLIIWPTHRVLGGMKDYSIEKFVEAAGKHMTIVPAGDDLSRLEAAMQAAAEGAGGRNVLGLYDAASGRTFVATLASANPLVEKFPGKPKAWRQLDVAVIQYVLVNQIAEPMLNGGQPVKWAFPHTINEVREICSGSETGAGGGKAFVAQLAVIVRPTPLTAVRDVSRANELMPQKSTFFYPKIATGLFVNPLE